MVRNASYPMYLMVNKKYDDEIFLLNSDDDDDLIEILYAKMKARFAEGWYPKVESILKEKQSYIKNKKAELSSEYTSLTEAEISSLPAAIEKLAREEIANSRAIELKADSIFQDELTIAELIATLMALPKEDALKHETVFTRRSENTIKLIMDMRNDHQYEGWSVESFSRV